MKPAYLLFCLLIIAAGCEVTERSLDVEPEVGEVVEFYLIENYMTGMYDATIDEKGATLKDTVLIGYDEILWYNSRTFSFKIADEALKRLRHYDAFAVTVDREIIYTGYFWTSLSSRSVNWVVVDLLMSKNSVISVELGYPGKIEGTEIRDRRNDPRILNVLKRDNKLIEASVNPVISSPDRTGNPE